MQIKKKTFYYLYYLFCFLVFLEPAYLSRIKLVDTIFLLFKIALSAITLIILVFYSKGYYIYKKDLPFIILLTFIPLNTLIHNGVAFSVFETIWMYIILSCVIGRGIRRHPRIMMNCLSFVLYFYIVINFLTILFFPEGLYITYSTYDNAHVCWFLGYKNPISRQVVLGLGINNCNSYLQRSRLSVWDFILYLISFISIYLVDSATGLIAVFFLFISVFFFRKSWLLKKVSVFGIFIFCFVVTLLIYFYDFQYYFADFIVNVLHRNVTLTSRIYIWELALEYILKRPLFGYGIEQGSVTGLKLLHSHTHNYYLYLLYTGGVVGTILCSYLIYYVSKKISRYRDNMIARICLLVISAVFVMGISESLTQMPLLYPFFVLSYYLVDKEKPREITHAN